MLNRTVYDLNIDKLAARFPKLDWSEANLDAWYDDLKAEISDQELRGAVENLGKTMAALYGNQNVGRLINDAVDKIRESKRAKEESKAPAWPSRLPNSRDGKASSDYNSEIMVKLQGDGIKLLRFPGESKRDYNDRRMMVAMDQLEAEGKKAPPAYVGWYQEKLNLLARGAA